MILETYVAQYVAQVTGLGLAPCFDMYATRALADAHEGATPPIHDAHPRGPG